MFQIKNIEYRFINRTQIYQQLLSHTDSLVPGCRLKVTTPVPPDTISLLLVDPEGMDRPLSESETSAVFAEPPYWSFCWQSIFLPDQN